MNHEHIFEGWKPVHTFLKSYHRIHKNALIEKRPYLQIRLLHDYFLTI